MISMPAIRFSQGGVELFSGVLPARDIVDLMIVDRWSREAGWDLDTQGYQRQIYDEHIKEIREFITKYSDELLPTAIVGVVREDKRNLVRFVEKDGALGRLEFTEGSYLYVVDG